VGVTAAVYALVKKFFQQLCCFTVDKLSYSSIMAADLTGASKDDNGVLISASKNSETIEDIIPNGI